MKSLKAKYLTVSVLALLMLTCFIILRTRSNTDIPDMGLKMENYKDSEHLFFVQEDYTAEGSVVLSKGYYESVNLIGTSHNIFIPIDPVTLERLPSNQYTDGTTTEFEGEKYRINVKDNEYSATKMEEHE